MQVANTRVSLILALKNDKNSERWEEFVNQYYAYLHYAAFSRDEATGRYRFIPDGICPEDVVEQTFWQVKNIVLPDIPQFDVDFTEEDLAKKVRHGLKWKIFELEKGGKFRNFLLSVLKNVARTMYNKRKSERLVFVDDRKLEGGSGGECDLAEAEDNRYEGYGESEYDREASLLETGDEDSWREWDDDIEAFERSEVLEPGQTETENESRIKWLAAQHAIEVVMSDPRIEKQTKEIYGLLIRHAQEGERGDREYESIAKRFKLSTAAIYKHRQRMEERLMKYYKEFLAASEIEG